MKRTIKNITLVLVSLIILPMCGQDKKPETIVVLLSSNVNECSDPADIELTLTIENNTSEAQKICTYHTPFEGIMNHFHDVIDGDGEDISYLGVMKKRSGPSEKDYINLKAGDSKTTTYSISESYDMKTGSSYKITFEGNEYMNKLPDSNSIEIIVK